MKSILSELIYEIEGFSDTPKAAIKSFKQDPDNPKKYFLEIEDLRETPNTKTIETLDGKVTDFEEGAENENN